MQNYDGSTFARENSNGGSIVRKANGDLRNLEQAVRPS